MTGPDLNELDARGSMLFLGSGFSKLARNIRGAYLPTGNQLSEEFAKILHVDAADYDLKTLADEVAGSGDLYQILYKLFTVQEVHEDQIKIVKLPWRRIYTTNYDDAIESCHLKEGNIIDSFSYDDPKPRKLSHGSVIHLHGSIRNANSDNVSEQLILNEHSYVRQHFEKSPWYDDFIRDLRFCTACFFVGYSLSDYHISALLMQNPTTREKTYFITKDDVDRIYSNRVDKYGRVLSIGTDGFAELCRTLPKAVHAKAPHNLKAYRYLDPFMDRKSLAPPTANEVLNLVTYGTFNYQRCLSTLPRGEYVVPRHALAEEAAAELEEAKCLLVHSWIGNGKTIFVHVLAHLLSERGYRCFSSRANPVILPRDLEILNSFKSDKLVIIFDSYNDAIDLIEQLTELPSQTKFIVTVRTGVQEVRLHEIHSKLPKPLKRINLNGLRGEDRRNFITLLDRTGIRASDMEKVIEKSHDVRDIVAALYGNDEIRRKINDEFSPLLNDQEFKQVFVVSHLLKWIGQDVDAGFVRSVTQRDAYAAIAKFREAAGDIFALGDDGIEVRSAIFSEYLVQNHVGTQDVADGAHSILVEAVKRKVERRYQAILSGLMRFSILNRALINDPDRIEALRSLFDRLRRDTDMNMEPLFWLQYSILMNEAGDLKSAEGFIRTAYSRAERSPGFQTFQIDTYALKLFLLLEQGDKNAPVVTRFDEISEKLERIRSIIGETDRRYHAIQVLEGIEPFVAARIQDLAIAEMNVLVYHINLLIDILDNLPHDDQIATGSKDIQYSLSSATYS